MEIKKHLTCICDVNNSQTVIDYILKIKKWKNLAHNVEAYNCFSTCGSENYLITATVCPRLNIDKASLKKNRFKTLSTEENTISDSYGKFVIANEFAEY